MKKVVLALVFAFSVSAFVIGCGGGSPTPTTPKTPEKKTDGAGDKKTP